MTNTIIIDRRSPTTWIIAGCIVIIALLIWNGCRVQRNKGAQLTAAEALLRVQDSVMAEQVRRHSLEDSLFLVAKTEATEARVKAEGRADSMARIVQGQLKTNRALIAQRDMYREALPDSTYELVHPRFRRDCDDCFNQLAVTTAQVEGYRMEDSAKDKLIEYEVSIRDREIGTLKKQRDTAYQHANMSLMIARQIVKDVKPRWRLYLSGSAGWTPQGVQAGMGFTYADKKSTMVTVQGLWQNGYGVQVGVHKLLSLKRR
jgi:hypothetical protein